VIQEAYVQGISTRSVHNLVKALGMTGVSKSQVSRLRKSLRAEAAARHQAGAAPAISVEWWPSSRGIRNQGP